MPLRSLWLVLSAAEGFVDSNLEVPVSSPRILFRHLLLIACFALLAVSAAKAQTIVQQNGGAGQLNCGAGCTQMPLGAQLEVSLLLPETPLS
ncbi:MAG: hypothetical protein DMG35_08415 [Acidobacteria bacterium]|nr:MAG: hypothetical protein AUH86_21605 [Acidobacteria bacterium 13_1_40CM_4_58_4]PYT61990.1 MAG: hypothetical protein DMG35_08415 [Acidobacteriota bacterium]